MMDDLVTWLGEQLDDDERTATLISAGGYEPQRWYSEPGATTRRWIAIYALDRTSSDPPGVYEDGGNDGIEMPVALVPNGRREHVHIARWSPARVVAEVEAKRAILALRQPLEADYARHTAVDGGAVTALEDVIRALALPYRDRPGWKPEWAPQSVS